MTVEEDRRTAPGHQTGAMSPDLLFAWESMQGWIAKKEFIDLVVPEVFSGGSWGHTFLDITVQCVTLSMSLSDSHSLRYYKTAVSSPGHGLPVYSSVGYVDDQEITNYNSDTRQCLPKVEWMKKVGEDYWERNTQRGQVLESAYKRNVQTAMRRHNQTGGIHFFQAMYGCELRDDGSTAGYVQHGYDGRDFMYLDAQRGIFIPAMSEAQITTQSWNSPHVRSGEIHKNYLENECIDWLKKYISYGREDLERRVRPEVKVWAHQSDGVTTLHCLVYGFHPRAVEVTWVRNGTDHMISLEAKTILPHPDGTYRTRVSVEVPTREGDSYSCHVDHSSLDEVLAVRWEPPPETSWIKVAIYIVIAVVATVLALVVVIWRTFNSVRPDSLSGKQKGIGVPSNSYDWNLNFLTVLPMLELKTYSFRSLILAASGTESLSYTTTS
ncbi:class I histocompatibility antigen, F10 alpha chain-like [Gastrophryne carolinensis]